MPIKSVQPFEVRVERRDGAVVLEFVGELDLVRHEQATTALSEAVSQTSLLVVNLQGLSFLGSTGLRCLVRAKALADAVGTRLAILNGSGPAYRLLELTRMNDAFEMVDDLTQLDPPAVSAA